MFALITEPWRDVLLNPSSCMCAYRCKPPEHEHACMRQVLCFRLPARLPGVAGGGSGRARLAEAPGHTTNHADAAHAGYMQAICRLQCCVHALSHRECARMPPRSADRALPRQVSLAAGAGARRLAEARCRAAVQLLLVQAGGEVYVAHAPRLPQVPTRTSTSDAHCGCPTRACLRPRTLSGTG